VYGIHLPYLGQEEVARCGENGNEPYLLNYLLTPWNRVFLEKLTGFQLVKKFPAFYGTLGGHKYRWAPIITFYLTIAINEH
jgi:hypothetical protein